MSKQRAVVPAVVCVMLAAVLPAGAEEPEAEQDSTLWTQILTLYQQAKDTGETVTDDVYEWAKNDLETIGDWEYKVVYLPSANHINLQKRLNELGTERWEIAWIDRGGAHVTLTLKRPSRTWLNKLPLGQLIKLAAPGGGEGGG